MAQTPTTADVRGRGTSRDHAGGPGVSVGGATGSRPFAAPLVDPGALALRVRCHAKQDRSRARKCTGAFREESRSGGSHHRERPNVRATSMARPEVLGSISCGAPSTMISDQPPPVLAAGRGWQCLASPRQVDDVGSASRGTTRPMASSREVRRDDDAEKRHRGGRRMNHRCASSIGTSSTTANPRPL